MASRPPAGARDGWPQRRAGGAGLGQRFKSWGPARFVWDFSQSARCRGDAHRDCTQRKSVQGLAGAREGRARRSVLRLSVKDLPRWLYRPRAFSVASRAAAHGAVEDAPAGLAASGSDWSARGFGCACGGRWCYLGSASREDEIHGLLANGRPEFDLDVYKILRKAMRCLPTVAL